MIPIQLRITGFLSYQEEAALDFTAFDLACISGSNGAGKSSLLDAITWALFGQARRRDDALINSHSQAAEVIFDFGYEGNQYRVQRSKPRDKSTVLEFLINQSPPGEPAVWRPLTERSVRETQARIQSTLRMDYDTFTNASFLLQGQADRFAQQPAGERKKVLSAILGLEIWEDYRANAAERRKSLELDLRAADGQIAEIDAELDQEEARRQRLTDIEDRLEAAHKLREARESGLDALRRLTAALEEQRRVVDLLEGTAREGRLRCERFIADLNGLRAERDGYRAVLAAEAEVTAAYARWMALRAELERWDAVAANFREIDARRAAPLAAIAAEEARLEEERRGLAVQEQAVAQEAGRLEQVEGQWGEASAEVERLSAEVAVRAEREREVREEQAQAVERKAENGTLRAAMNDLKARMNRIQAIEGAVCPLCGGELSEDHRAGLLAQLEAEGKEMGDRFRANSDLLNGVETRVAALQAQITALGRSEEELRARQRQLDRLEADRQRITEKIAEWQSSGATRLRDLARCIEAQDFALAARAALAEIDEQARALGYDSASHDAARRAETVARGAEGEMRGLEAARASLAPLERQIAGLEEQLRKESEQLVVQEQRYQTALEKYQADRQNLPDINEVEREVYNLRSEENRLRMEQGMARQSVAVLASQRDRRAKLFAQRDAISLQIARLKTLERAFSKDGVPALLIEQALPEIETRANELLDRLSGGQMAVRFETQRPFKDKAHKDLKETLDIIISDSAGPREYELFSGGEAFRVNFSIRLALSEVLAQRAGARLQTLVIDEGFGSQDAEGRQRLIEAINLVREDFQKILVITHLEELKEAFPARIEVEKTLTGSKVRIVSQS